MASEIALFAAKLYQLQCANKQDRSNNAESELVIWGQFEGHFDEFGTFKEIGEVVRMIRTIPKNFELFLSLEHFRSFLVSQN